MSSTNTSKWKPLTNKYKAPMTKIFFIKKDILKAIKKTPIHHGSFFQNNNLSSLTKSCKVDVIGAILTHCILNKKARGVDGNAIGYALYIQGSIYHSYENFLINKEYLSALDTYFETIDRDLRISKPKIKILIIEFIQKNFPTRFSMKLSSIYKSNLKGFK